MKTTYITLISLFTILLGYSKDTRPLDTIYANDKMNMALFFPSNIKQGITGASHFIFTYNREKGQNLGLLKAIKGEDSNLLIITTDGNIYSYIIKYTENLKNPNRFVLLNERIGNENRALPVYKKDLDTLKKEASKKILPIIENKEATALKKASKSLLKLPERRKITKSKKGIAVGIKNIVYHNDKVYMQFEVKNRSGIDFDVDFLNLYRVNGNKKRKASYQKLALIPIYKYDLPQKVRHGEKVRFVYVFDKFTLGDNEKLLIKLQEENGSRYLEMKRGLFPL